jgi:hypothetical protein
VSAPSVIKLQLYPTLICLQNSKFEVLVDRLEHEYGSNHTVVHYIAAMLPHHDPVIDKYTVAQLREPEIAKKIGGVSTFYIPPRERKNNMKKMVETLQLLPEGITPDPLAQIYPPNQWDISGSAPAQLPYGPAEIAAIAQIDGHVPPEEYQPLATSKAMVEVMTQLALDPKTLMKYKADQSAFAQSVPGLSSQERSALEIGDMWALRCAMKNMPISLVDTAEKHTENYSGTGFPWIVVLGVVGLVASVSSTI